MRGSFEGAWDLLVRRPVQDDVLPVHPEVLVEVHLGGVPLAPVVREQERLLQLGFGIDHPVHTCFTQFFPLVLGVRGFVGDVVTVRVVDHDLQVGDGVVGAHLGAQGHGGEQGDDGEEQALHGVSGI